MVSLQQMELDSQLTLLPLSQEAENPLVLSDTSLPCCLSKNMKSDFDIVLEEMELFLDDFSFDQLEEFDGRAINTSCVSTTLPAMLSPTSVDPSSVTTDSIMKRKTPCAGERRTKRRRKSTYANRKEEVLALRQQSVTLENTLRGLQEEKQRQLLSPVSRSALQKEEQVTLACAEAINQELKAAVLQQEAQIKQLIDSFWTFQP